MKTGLAAGLGGLYLTGCSGGSSGPVEKKNGGITTRTPTPTQATPSGLPAGLEPMGLGVNGHFISVSDLNAQIDRLAAVGFDFMRLDLLWNAVERSKGQFDFSGYQGIASALAAHNIRPFFILDYDNSLYDDTNAPSPNQVGPHTVETRQAFGRFAAQAASAFKEYSVVWEIWNEPDNPTFWYPQPDPAGYMALVKASTGAMRQADPHATIVAPALTGLQPQYPQAWEFLESCFAEGLAELVDAISVHPYRIGPPESAASDYQRLRALLARYATGQKKTMPLIDSEWGYSLTWVSQLQQAQFFVRLYIINLVNALPLSIWYDWQDDGPDLKNVEDNFGMITWNGQPKIVYFAAQTLTSELAGLRFAWQMATSSNADYNVLFTNGTASKQVLWTTGDPHTITLSVNGTSATLTSMTGKKETQPITGGQLTLELTGSPQYLALNAG